MKIYSPFKTQDPENYTLFCGTYPFRPNKEVAPGIQREAGRGSKVQFSLNSVGKLPMVWSLMWKPLSINFKKIKFDLSPTNHLNCHSEISRGRSGYCYSIYASVSGTFVRVKMADNSADKGPWTKMLESFIRYVALNPKEFLLYGN